MRMKGYHKIFKSVLSAFLAVVLLFSAIPNLFQKGSAAGGATVSCDVKFSMPAICCDVGDMIDLTKCGVQFAAQSYMVKSSINWTHNGAAVTSFTPTERGVFSLSARSGSYTRTIYVVAKEPEETQYVLYRNDFDTAPTNFRLLENTNGATVSVSNGSYIMDASGNADAYVRVLLPKFLDVFGDVKITANMKIASAVDEKKWASMMYRVQKENYPYYQTCIRANTNVANGVEISQRNAQNAWEVYRKGSFSWFRSEEYNLCSITARGTQSIVNINGYQINEYSNTAYAAGAMGFQTRGAKLMIDYVEVALEGNVSSTVSCDVSYAKPAIRADMGDTIDLSGCDVQFKANEIYTKGSTITWKKDGKQISTLTPTQSGVIKLTATSGTVTKNVYVVTRTLNDGEYVLYSNTFDITPSDFRVVQKTNATIAIDNAGHYVLDASAGKDAYARVLLPSFLDEFGDGMLTAVYKDVNAVDEKKWTALMGRVQSKDYPYIQFCIRSNSALANGLEITQKLEAAQNAWEVKNKASFNKKTAEEYNTFTLSIQNNHTTGYINHTEVISYDTQNHDIGGWGFQTRGMKMIIDSVKFTLGETTAQQDTAVVCHVANSRPAIGCNAGQTILLSQCPVQFSYGTYPVDPSQITWKKDGKVITEFSDTSVGIHTLTATHGDTTMTVYVVAKKAIADQYILYSTTFDKAPMDLRVPENSNGASCYHRSEGTFCLDGTAGQSAYSRILLPGWLDAFGDAELRASIKITGALDAGKWASLTYRTQPGDAVYNHALLRYDSTVENGVEIAKKNSSADGDWTVLAKNAAPEKVGDTWREVILKVQGKNTWFYVDGVEVANYNDTPFGNGAWGFMVRGSAMLIDWLRVCFKENMTQLDYYMVPGGFADVRQMDTGLKAAPSMITDVKTKADLNKILNDSPAVAIMNYDVLEGVPMVTFSDGMITAEEAMIKLGSKVIPAFRISTNAQAESLAIFLRGRSQRDVYAVSDKLDVLQHANDNWQYIRGVADFSKVEGLEVSTLRVEALAKSAKVLILPENTSGEDVTWLQDRFSAVWMKISEGKTATVTAINKGVYGIITPNRAVTASCYTTYFTDDTLVRTPVVVGQKGNPTKAPENTIMGAQLALSNGADGVEMDVQRTTDNVAIVMHDDTLDRTTNGTGKVTEKSKAQIQQYKVDYYSGVAAQTIPTLEQYFSLVQGQPDQRLFIDIKGDDAQLVTLVLSLVEKYDMMDQVAILSDYSVNLDRVHEQLPGVPVSMVTGTAMEDHNALYGAYYATYYADQHTCVYSPSYSGWGAPVVQEVSYRGVSLWPRDVNTQAQFDKALISGAAGIYTEGAQWASDYIENLTWNSSGKVIATTYKGDVQDVTASAEIVIVEDTLGVTCNAGNINVPTDSKGGMVSFYYRYKCKTASGGEVYVASQVRTIQVGGAAMLQLISGSSLAMKDGYLVNVTDKDTVSAVKAQFKYPVVILNKNGGTMDDNAVVATGATVCLASDYNAKALIVMRGDVNGDGKVNTTDYVRIKSYFLKKAELTEAYAVAADCDGDSKITTADYIRVKSYFLKKLDLFA